MARIVLLIIAFVLLLLLLSAALIGQPRIELLVAIRNSVYYCPTYNGGKIMNELYQQMGLIHTSNPKSAELYIPCGYTWVESELRKYSPSTANEVILAIDGCDQIVAKNGLWKILRDAFGTIGATALTPRTYIAADRADMQDLTREYANKTGQIYIMKKNIQRQQGLKLTTSLSELLAAASGGYAVIQKYLMNPLLIDGRKFDIRVYLLIVQQNGQQWYYRHAAGRCHYAKRDYDRATLDWNVHIPTGYLEDAAFKARHPETLKELKPILGQQFFARLDQSLAQCCQAFSKVLGNNSRYRHKICGQLFGLDYLCDDQYQPTLIEINKGPELAWNTETEHQFKRKIVTDMFELLGLPVKENTPNEFMLIYKK